MITGQQLLDAIVHADEWPDELMQLRQANAELQRRLDATTGALHEAQAKADFYYDAYISQQKRRELK